MPPPCRPRCGRKSPPTCAPSCRLALTQDGGRYPTLAGFIRELASLTDDADAAPGEGLAADGENAVRLLTIHGAKGLEAPIVWLLGGSDHARGDSYAVLAPWPPTRRSPRIFRCSPNRPNWAAAARKWFEDEAQLAQRESDNLLYVALTRAEQALIVSGDAAKNAWVERVAAAWQDAGLPTDLPPAAGTEAVPAMQVFPSIAAPAIGQRLTPTPATPAAARGELFHACLEIHAPPSVPAARDLSALAVRLGLGEALAGIEADARALLAQPGSGALFRPGAVSPRAQRADAAGCGRPRATARPRGGI